MKTERKNFTGWKTINGYDVKFTDGKSCGGVKKSVTGCGVDPAYFWTPCKGGGWDRVYSGLTEAQIRGRLHRGTLLFF